VADHCLKNDPELSQSFQRRERVRGFGVPMDLASQDFRREAANNSFPFEDIKQTTMKIKTIPIKLRWPSNGENPSSYEESPGGKWQTDFDCYGGGANQSETRVPFTVQSAASCRNPRVQT